MLLENKKAFEQFFMDNYTETDIHWSGQKFDVTGRDEWVYFEYKPTASFDLGLDNEVYHEYGNLYVFITSETEFRSVEIADIVIALFKGEKVGTMFTRRIDIVSMGLMEDNDKHYVDLSVIVNTL